ncbi:MAG: DUF4263 domain-containing protein [Bacteroidetes bacterium]|nr:MAG: DUF4263 domain-containing protein [Bacteroidota bacterium]REK06575.1 MAG: DUF4263 domain-containing protein [Bacteroidota bacterium]REK33341.1 MAG: DUF4263 domain-containing protein [Bacteroidota bacterium]REK49741.1 MAG: DUF4263 domain-containing protein [Bacteroidota bacterium]
MQMEDKLTTDKNGIKKFHFYDANEKPLGVSKKLHLAKGIIVHYPFSFNRNTNELKPKRIKEIEFRGWKTEASLPKDFKSKSPYGFKSTRAKNFFSLLQREFKKFSKIIISKAGKTTFSTTTITFNWNDLLKILRAIEKNKTTSDETRKVIIRNGLADINKKYRRRPRELTSGEFQNFIGNYSSFSKLNDSDLQIIADMMGSIDTTTIKSTEYILKTKERLDIRYLDDIISEFERLLKTRPKDEEEWQKYFQEHTWTLNHLFPFQVILFKGKAYVGGKTLQNDEGRIVDFLFQNGFQDNFALLEIKTPGAVLLKKKAYRDPDVFSLSDELSGGLNQCLDQKNIFLTEFGKNQSAFDPRSLLVIGNKSQLTKEQAKCFELYRANQKNVDIVSFDELLSKLHVLRKVLTGKIKKV